MSVSAGAGDDPLFKLPLTPVWEIDVRDRLAALAIGMSFPLGRILVRVLSLQIGLGGELLVLGLLYLAGVAILCRPLRDYRAVGTMTLIAALGFSVVGGFNAFVSARHLVTEDTWVLLTSGALAFVVAWCLPWGMLSVVVLIRRRRWPIFPPGQCVRCGYDLRGLPDNVCPECGTAFGENDAGLTGTKRE